MSCWMSQEAAQERLVAYINGTLDSEGQTGVREHLRACFTCRRDEAEWRALALAATQYARAAAPEAAPRAVLDRVLAACGPLTLGSDPAPWRAPSGKRVATVSPSPLRHATAVLVAQLGVVRRSIWATSAVVFAIGSLVVAGRSLDAGTAFALLAPLIAAAGISLVCGSSVDPRLEVALSTATSPRLVLLARLVLVFAFDLGLAALASLALVATGSGGGLWQLVGAWLGPMLLLTSLSLIASVVTRSPALGITVGFSLWALRVLTLLPDLPLHGSPVAQLVASAWSTTLPSATLACALVVVTVLFSRAEART